MKLLKIASSIGVAVFFSLSTVVAQIPPAEQLLPDDTIAVLTVPDWTKLSANYGQSAWGQLWADAAMKPFRDNFTSNFQNDFLKPVEKELGIKLMDYQDLLQGQITIGITPPKEGSIDLVGFLVLIDSKDKRELLTTRLADLKKKWAESGKEVRFEKIRDVEFNSVAFTRKDIDALLKKAFPGADDEEEGEGDQGSKKEKIQLKIGQFKSLLIIGENEKSIEKVLARQTGGLVPPLAEKASYQKTHALLFRDSLAHGWVNIKPVYEKVLQQLSKQGAEETPGGMPGLRPDKILPALGFSSIETVGGKLGGGAEGNVIEAFVNAPETQREGLLKLLTLEKKDAAPPVFVPADVIKFQRTRIDGQKAWATLEGIVNKIDPSMAGLVQLMLSSAGKDQDPNFDLKKNLIGNLGDDVIQYEKAPKSSKPEDLAQAPTLLLIGSPNASQLLDALRMITSLLPPPLSSAPLKEREFLGRKIYSMSLASPAAAVDSDEGDGEKAPEIPSQSFSFTTSGGYVAFSTDNAILEEYLRSGENPPKALRGASGFGDAAQKAGGMENGFFSYENQVESLRVGLEAMKGNPEIFNQLFFFGRFGAEAEDEESPSGRLFNIKLLPSFDRISKYFGIAVASGGATPDGFLFKAVAPKPAGIK